MDPTLAAILTELYQQRKVIDTLEEQVRFLEHERTRLGTEMAEIEKERAR